MSKTIHDKGLNEAKQGKYQNAISFYNEAIHLGYETPDLYNDRAVAYVHVGDKLSAFNDFTKSKNLQPDYSYRYACLAFIKESMGDIDGAIADYEYALKLDPNDAVCYNNLGLLQEKKGYIKDAKVNFDMADKLKADKPLPEKIVDTEKTNAETTKQEVKKEIKKISLWSYIKSVFTDKQIRKEFLLFLKNGFKIK